MRLHPVNDHCCFVYSSLILISLTSAHRILSNKAEITLNVNFTVHAASWASYDYSAGLDWLCFVFVLLLWCQYFSNCPSWFTGWKHNSVTCWLSRCITTHCGQLKDNRRKKCVCRIFRAQTQSMAAKRWRSVYVSTYMHSPLASTGMIH